MTIPSPSIKPLLVPGGLHTARYVGAIGVVGSGGGVSAKAQGVAMFEIPFSTGVAGLNIGDLLSVGPDSLLFEILESAPNGSGDFTMLIQATEEGPLYNMPAWTQVRTTAPGSEATPDGYLIEDTMGGATGGGGVLHIDLTEFSERLRRDPHWVDQLQVVVQALDAGITDVGPRTLLPMDFFGAPVLEYLTLNAVSDSEANECVITVSLPHSHMR